MHIYYNKCADEHYYFYNFKFTIIPSGVLLDKSNFPISRKRPCCASSWTLDWSLSSASELRTTSTPRPRVDFRNVRQKFESRESAKQESFSSGNRCRKYFRLVADPTVVRTRQPCRNAIEIAAWPTAPLPEWMRTVSPARIWPRTTNA